LKHWILTSEGGRNRSVRDLIKIRRKMRIRVRDLPSQLKPGAEKEDDDPTTREDITRSARTVSGGGGTNRDNKLT
jgi:hypothetical protein